MREEIKNPKAIKKNIKIGKDEIIKLKKKVITPNSTDLECSFSPNKLKKEGMIFKYRFRINTTNHCRRTECTEQIKTKQSCERPHNIQIEMIKDGGEEIKCELVILYNECLKQGEIPKAWYISEVILIHKTGSKSGVNVESNKKKCPKTSNKPRAHGRQM